VGFAACDWRGYMEKEQMIQQMAEIMAKMYYEDVDFFWGMIVQFAKRKKML
jgi:hypothetical protein